MAPEQRMLDARIDHRADLYAWGVVAYEVLTGRRPFHEQSTTVPRLIGELAPELPPAIAALVMRCLATIAAADAGRSSGSASIRNGRSRMSSSKTTSSTWRRHRKPCS